MATRAKHLLLEVEGISLHAVKPTTAFLYIQSITAQSIEMVWAEPAARREEHMEQVGGSVQPRGFDEGIDIAVACMTRRTKMCSYLHMLVGSLQRNERKPVAMLQEKSEGLSRAVRSVFSYPLAGSSLFANVGEQS